MAADALALCVTLVISSHDIVYCQTSNIKCTLLGNEIVDHSGVVGASPAVFMKSIGHVRHFRCLFSRPKCLMRDLTNLNRIYIKPIGQCLMNHESFSGTLCLSVLIQIHLQSQLNTSSCSCLCPIHRSHDMASINWAKTTARWDEKH